MTLAITAVAATKVWYCCCLLAPDIEAARAAPAQVQFDKAASMLTADADGSEFRGSEALGGTPCWAC